MKRTLIAAYFALLISAVTAYCAVYLLQPQEEAAVPSPTQSAVSSATQLLVLVGDTPELMDMQEYLVGVVAAEMPASFQPEALKAQAVAARTYGLYCQYSGKHDNADVCTDYICCQAWLSLEDMRQNWGDSFDENYTIISTAVQDTVGQYLSYDGEPVFAAFHASSCGATEDCSEIWSQVPYLISVDSPESADTVPNYISSVELSRLDFRDTILSAYPEAKLSGDASEWVEAASLDNSGRVSSVTIGGVDIPGKEIRSLFSLRSTAFVLEYTGESFIFTVTGSGHGVGMSQYGANVMAADGSDYAQILAHYYPETVLVK